MHSGVYLTPEGLYCILTLYIKDPATFRKVLDIHKAGGEPWEKLRACIRERSEAIRAST